MLTLEKLARGPSDSRKAPMQIVNSYLNGSDPNQRTEIKEQTKTTGRQVGLFADHMFILQNKRMIFWLMGFGARRDAHSRNATVVVMLLFSWAMAKVYWGVSDGFRRDFPRECQPYLLSHIAWQAVTLASIGLESNRAISLIIGDRLRDDRPC